MGEATEDFINGFIYDMPEDVEKKYPKAKVINWKKIASGDFDDWSSGVAGIYEAYVVEENIPIAVITYKVTLQDRYDENGEQSFEGFEDAAEIDMKNIRFIRKTPLRKDEYVNKGKVKRVK